MNDRYECIYCGRDVRTAGGRSDQTSAICNRCLHQISGVQMAECEFCSWNDSLNTINIDHLSRDAGDITTNYRREQYRICSSCYAKLMGDRGFRLTVENNLCQICNNRYASVHVRFSQGIQLIRVTKCCTRCFPRVRASAAMIYEGIVNFNHSMQEGTIEQKDRLLYIWNPTEVEIKRRGGNTMASVRVTHRPGGMGIDVTQIRRAFIYDGDTIWVFADCTVDNLNRSIVPSDASFNLVTEHFGFIVRKFEKRSTQVELDRQTVRQEQEPQLNLYRDHVHNQIYTRVNPNAQGFFALGNVPAGDGSWGALTERPVIPEGKVSVWCSCGHRDLIDDNTLVYYHDTGAMTVASHITEARRGGCSFSFHLNSEHIIHFET